MAKSKRNQVVNTGKLALDPQERSKRVKDEKSKLLQDVQKAMKAHSHLYVYRVHNTKADLFQRMRLDLRSTSVLFFSRNRILTAAVRTATTDKQEELSDRVEELLNGPMLGLGFTNDPSGFEGYMRGEEAASVIGTADFPRTGDVATEDVELPAGPVSRLDDAQPMSPTVEAYLRTECGLPTLLKGGSVILQDPQVVCRAGETLTVRQARLLKALGKTMVQFRMELLFRYNLEQCAIEPVASHE